METLVFVLELIGACAFAISGALVGVNRNMDLFGISILGLSTAVGGGVVRDIILGECPPAMFTNPIYAIVGLASCLIVMIPAFRALISRTDVVMMLADAIGLGIFTASGTMHALASVHANLFLAVFVGVVTGVGGGLLRDVMANVPPFIFTRHIYATASIAGALLLCLVYPFVNRYLAMIVAAGLIVIIRIIAYTFDLNIPRVKTDKREENEGTIVG